MSKKPAADKPAEPAAVPDLVDIDLDDDDGAPPMVQGTPLFDYDLDKLEKQRSRGVDVQPAFWHVEKWIDGKRTSVDKTFPAHQASVAFLAAQFGGGTYACMMKNARGQCIARKTHTVVGPTPVDAAAVLGGGTTLAGNGAPRSGNMLDRVLEVMLLRALDPPKVESREDPMRDAMATIVKGMALQQQMATQALQLQMQMGDRQGAPAREESSRMFSLLERLAVSGGKSNGSAAGALSEVMPILSLGMNLGARMNGGGDKAKNEWLEMVPELADTIGVPLIVALSQTLPAEKAREALRAIEEHMKARQAEAAASAGTPPIDVPGTEVP